MNTVEGAQWGLPYVAIEAASARIESYCPSPSPGNIHQQTEHKSLACCSIPCSTDRHDTVPDSVETRWPPTRWSAWPSQVTRPLFSQHKLITRSLSSVELTISSWAFLLQELLRELRKSLQQERGSNVSAMLAPAVYQVLSISERDWCPPFNHLSWERQHFCFAGDLIICSPQVKCSYWYLSEMRRRTNALQLIFTRAWCEALTQLNYGKPKENRKQTQNKWTPPRYDFLHTLVLGEWIIKCQQNHSQIVYSKR